MKRTKRLLAAILSCAMVFALTACGGSDGTADGADSGSLKAIPKEDLKMLCVCRAGRRRRVFLCA